MFVTILGLIGAAFFGFIGLYLVSSQGFFAETHSLGQRITGAIFLTIALISALAGPIVGRYMRRRKTPPP